MTELVENTCRECGFDPARWTDQDAARTVGLAGELVGYAVERLPAGLAHQSPPPPVPTIAEALRRLAGGLATEPQAPAAEEQTDLPALVNAVSLHAGLRYRSLTQQDDAAGLVLAHRVMHTLAGIAAARTALGDTITPQSGEVAQISASSGGVPKQAILSATIDGSGVEGDRQAARAHHGRPWQALCLYSAEVIAQLQAEGHSIIAGAAGENITVAGIDWVQIRAGLFMDIGEVRVQISAPALPCSKNARWFADGDSTRMLHERFPGFSRWYASVLRGGTVQPGDPIRLASKA